MSPEHKIARHHLGDRLHYVAIADDDVAILVSHDDAPLQRFAAHTVDEAARAAAAQLRAAGWVPTHPRLEWEQEGEEYRLMLRTGKASAPLWWILPHRDHHIAATSDDVTPEGCGDLDETLADVLATISAWVAENLPYHLPPFPGDKP